MAFRYRRFARKRPLTGTRWQRLKGLPEFLAGYEGASSNVTTIANSQVTYDSSVSALNIGFVGEGVNGTSPNTFKLVSPISLDLGDNHDGTLVATIDLKFDPTMREVSQGGQANDQFNNVWKGLQFLADNNTTGSPTIFWESRHTPQNASTSAMLQQGQRSYADLVTGQTSKEQFRPRGLASKVSGDATDNSTALVPYGQWARMVYEIVLNQDESAFADWNTQIAPSVLADGTYHRCSVWLILEDGTTHCQYWRVPLAAVNAGANRTYIREFWVEFDQSAYHSNSTGTVRFTGVDGSVIQRNTQFYTSDGRRYMTESSAVISGGSVDIPCFSAGDGSSGLPKTAGYYANLSSGTVFTFSPTSPPTGFDDASVSLNGFVGGVDVLESPGADMWFKEVAILRNYTLPEDSTTDTLIFTPPTTA